MYMLYYQKNIILKTPYLILLLILVWISLVTGYTLTVYSKTCLDINSRSILDEEECKEAIQSFGKRYEKDEESSLYPKGCYLFGTSRGYFNRHKLGSSNQNAKSVCKGNCLAVYTTYHITKKFSILISEENFNRRICI